MTILFVADRRENSDFSFRTMEPESDAFFVSERSEKSPFCYRNDENRNPPPVFFLRDAKAGRLATGIMQMPTTPSVSD